MGQNGGGGDGSAAPASIGSRKNELVPQLQFAPGFHFVPTDEELVNFHLPGKIEGREPPLDLINEVDIMRCDPEKLIEEYKGYGENRWYFFTVREPSKTKKDEPNRKVVVDGVEEGSWSATRSVLQIHSTKETNRKAIVGNKRVLTYRSLRSAENDKWSMHEYVMAGKSQMGQYVLCAIQLKQTYEGVKKAGEEGKSGNKRKRNAARREMQPTFQAQEEQHETPPPEEETTGDPDQFIDAPSMHMMFGGEDTPLIPSFAPCNDGMLQLQALQLENPAMLYSQEPLYIADQLMITPCCNGNCQRLFYQKAENGSVAFREALDHQQHDRALENTGVYPNNILVDGNMADYSQCQICNQDNGGVLIEGSEYNATFPGTFMMSEQMAAGRDDVSGCDYADGQSMAVQHNVAGTIHDYISSLLNGNGDGDNVE